MIKRVVALACLVGIALATIAAETPGREKPFRDAVLNRQRYLRNYSVDSKIGWRWDGTSLISAPPVARMLGAVVARSIEIKGNKIEIRATRYALLRRADSTLAVSPYFEDVRMEINLEGADLDTVLPKLADMLFYPDVAAAMANLPPRLRMVLPEEVNAARRHSPKIDYSKCDCADLSGEACHGADTVEMTMAGVKPPEVIRQVDPELPKAAARLKLGGKVIIAGTVETSGKIDDLWITQGTGFHLDESAARAVSQYVFTPATCHSEPVAADLHLEVNFDIF